MRQRFADIFFYLAQQDPRLHLIVADISPAGSIEKFRKAYPERFINTGVSEQVMIGMAAGMAQKGLRVFCYTIATFALFRPFEMIRDDLAYQGLPVTVVGIGGGLTYSSLGATHHAQEDIAVATAIPGLQVIAPCDPLETAAATTWCAQYSTAPTYLRLGKAGEPDLTDSAINKVWLFGRLRYLRKGRDVCIMSYGPTMSTALELAGLMQEQFGSSVSVVGVHTLKPLDREGIARALIEHPDVIVVEETTGLYGLGAQVKMVAHDLGGPVAARVQTFGLLDKFIHCYGTHTELLEAHGLTARGILDRLDMGG